MLNYLFPFFYPKKDHWASAARILHWLTLLWLLIGLVVLFSASYPIASEEVGDGLHYVKRQGIWAYLGLIVLNVITLTPISRLLKITPPILITLLGLIIATKFWGEPINGAQRWIGVGSLLIQPSELIKPFLVLQGALVFSYWPQITVAKRVFWLGIFALILGAVLIQPHLSNTALCGMSLWLIALAGMIRWRSLGLVALTGVGFAVASILSNEYQRRRVTSFLHPWEQAAGDGYQLTQSLIAIGSGGTWGSGFGLSHQKLFYLPIQYTDFIFAVFAEEFGFAGCVVLLVLIMSWATVAVFIASQAQNRVHCLIAVGALNFMVGQGLINIAVATGFLPTTGLPFPLFSYGGNSVLASLFLAALVIRVARENKEGNVVEFPQPSRE